MRTLHSYGSRTVEERFKSGTGHSMTWVCDNPKCQKTCHYTPYCPNTVSNVIVTFLKGL